MCFCSTRRVQLLPSAAPSREEPRNAVCSTHGMCTTFPMSRQAENLSPRGRAEEEHERASHFWRFITRRVDFFAHDIAPARLRHAYRVHAKSRPALKHGAWTLSTLPRRLFIGLTSMRAQLMRAMPGCCCWSSPFSLRCEKVLTEKTYTRSYPHSDWPKILRSSERLWKKIRDPLGCDFSSVEVLAR